MIPWITQPGTLHVLLRNEIVWGPKPRIRATVYVTLRFRAPIQSNRVRASVAGMSVLALIVDPVAAIAFGFAPNLAAISRSQNEHLLGYAACPFQRLSR